MDTYSVNKHFCMKRMEVVMKMPQSGSERTRWGPFSKAAKITRSGNENGARPTGHSKNKLSEYLQSICRVKCKHDEMQMSFMVTN